MAETEIIYDLEERTLRFARMVRSFLRELKFSTANYEDGKQLIRSSGSVGANYIEANEALGFKDQIFRFKICRKEAKESRFWLVLIDCRSDIELEKKRNILLQESLELVKIFSSIIKKIEK
ncbi:MAG: four helix bundle protein [Candidatus Uhrbacteria bacterium]